MAARNYNEQDFMKLGLETARYERWETYKHHTNVERFVESYGATPKTCADMWADLNILNEVHKKSKPMHMLMALRFLWKNDTELGIARFFGYSSRNTARIHVKDWVDKIQTLLVLKMLTFEQTDDGLTFFMTVDCTHCRCQEPKPFSTIWSSFKFGGDAGLNYEIGLSINKAKLIWLRGPFPAGFKNDLELAKEALIPAVRAHNVGKANAVRILADGIYDDIEVHDVVSVENELDPSALVEFKGRAQSRMENFNGLLKSWNVLEEVFKSHDLDEHQICMEAVCAITCYQLDNGSYSLLDAHP